MSRNRQILAIFCGSFANYLPSAYNLGKKKGKTNCYALIQLVREVNFGLDGGFRHQRYHLSVLAHH